MQTTTEIKNSEVFIKTKSNNNIIRYKIIIKLLLFCIFVIFLLSEIIASKI